MLLCYVTNRRLLNEPASLDDLLSRIESASAAGIDWIQIREKDLPARELAHLTRRAVAVCHRTALPERALPKQIIVNDRIDVALAAGAAGVHLAASSVPAAETIRWLRSGNAPGDFSVGISCHSLADAIAAEKAGATYVFFGPVYETPSKISLGQPQGLEKLSETCRALNIPILAIGGITEGNAAACIRAGASGIAAIRLFQQITHFAALEALVARLQSTE